MTPRSLLCRILLACDGEAGLDAASADMLTDPRTDHHELARLAGRHLVTPALAEAVAATPSLEQRLPENFAAYLALIRIENRRRSDALRRQLAEATARLNAVAIEPVLLKGAIRLVDNLYPDAAWRFMRDLDLLIPHHRLDDAVSALARDGYGFRAAARALPADHRHRPGLVREGDAAPIELHHEPLARLRAVCDAQSMSARSRPVDIDGGRARLPDEVDQLVHLIAHDRDDDELRHAGRFLLRSAVETALLCRNPQAAPEALGRFTASGAERMARVHLLRTARLFATIAPTLTGSLRGGSAAVRALTSLELIDDRGHLRRLYWFARTRTAELRHRASARRQLMRHLQSKEFYAHCLRRLREVWADA